MVPEEGHLEEVHLEEVQHVQAYQLVMVLGLVLQAYDQEEALFEMAATALEPARWWRKPVPGVKQEGQQAWGA